MPHISWKADEKPNEMRIFTDIVSIISNLERNICQLMSGTTMTNARFISNWIWSKNSYLMYRIQLDLLAMVVILDIKWHVYISIQYSQMNYWSYNFGGLKLSCIKINSKFTLYTHAPEFISTFAMCNINVGPVYTNTINHLRSITLHTHIYVINQGYEEAKIAKSIIFCPIKGRKV